MNVRVDQAEMRRSNMALILQSLRARGPRPRAQLAAETGLSKATTSTLVGDLVERGLVREEDLERTGTVGRPGTMVALDGTKVFGIGVEINVDFLAVTVMDLRGRVTQGTIVPLDVAATAVEDVLDRIAELIGAQLHQLRKSGGQAKGIGIAAPGIVDLESGSVRFAPNLGWRGVAVATGLQARLGPEVPPIYLENDSKLGVIAEFATRQNQDVQDLMYLSADVGVGAGIIAGGRLLRGWFGFAGEVGHLPLDPTGTECHCGRTGCWETLVGLNSFLRLAADPDDDVHDRSKPLEDRLQTLRRRADAGDTRTLDALATIAGDLATGLSVLVDVINPRVIVLGGYFTAFNEYLVAPVTAKLEPRRMDAGSTALVTVSRLGLSAASQGGAQQVLEGVFGDPTSTTSWSIPRQPPVPAAGIDNFRFVS